MKPKNFPERKRQRQLDALARLKDRISAQHGGDNAMRQDIEVVTLERRTVDNLRDIRTKKYGPRKKGRIASDLRD